MGLGCLMKDKNKLDFKVRTNRRMCRGRERFLCRKLKTWSDIPFTSAKYSLRLSEIDGYF